ncbi:collectin-11 [Plakobranchus ocellatus]|uniref:Collectin-11 n=1 Tax=Plakobranchus ocellatus TaxID=259542 RepID=A0AAV3Y3I8_9GAST|nr:collectin-11 [Plakobranchus ocellatus]
MSLQPILIFGVLAITSAFGSSSKVSLSVDRPLNASQGSVPLKINCTFDKQKSGIRTVKRVRLLRSKIGDNGKPKDYSLIASVTPSNVNNVLGESEIVVSGEINQERYSNLDVEYKSLTEGYCYMYKCAADGPNIFYQKRSRIQTIRVRSINEGTCKKLQKPLIPDVSKAPSFIELQKEVYQCCVSSDVIKEQSEAIEQLEDGVNECSQKTSDLEEEMVNNAEKYGELANKVEAFNKLLSINTAKYIVSSIYKGKFYTLNREDMVFNLETMNNLCKGEGGRIMSLQPIFLLLGFLALASAFFGSLKKVSFTVDRPPKTSQGKIPLRIKCTFDKHGSGMKTVNSVSLLRSKIGDGGVLEGYELIVSVTPSKMNNVLGESEIVVSGEIEEARYSNLGVKYISPTEGFCYMYKCIADGSDFLSQNRSRFETIRVRSINEGTCEKPQKPFSPDISKAPSFIELQKEVNECCVSSDIIKEQSEAIEQLEDGVNECSEKTSDLEEEMLNNAERYEELTNNTAEKYQELANKVEAFNKLLSINTVKYIVSSIYKGRVYTLNREDMVFNLETMNNLCKGEGGYLVEFKDQDEQEFAETFVALVGNRIVLTGANCVEKACTFVYYNSKKPVTNVKWLPREPNNCKRVEQCVNIRRGGLSDIRCKGRGRFMCEILLM